MTLLTRSLGAHKVVANAITRTSFDSFEAELNCFHTINPFR